MAFENNPATGLKFPVITCSSCGETSPLFFDPENNSTNCINCNVRYDYFQASCIGEVNKGLRSKLQVDPGKVVDYLTRRQEELDKENILLTDLSSGRFFDTSQDYWIKVSGEKHEVEVHKDAVKSTLKLNILEQLRPD